jgi:hypothetical protein
MMETTSGDKKLTTKPLIWEQDMGGKTSDEDAS